MISNAKALKRTFFLQINKLLGGNTPHAHIGNVRFSKTNTSFIWQYATKQCVV